MKIAIYGGSFNPIHYGHIGLARWVVANTDIDELWLMVTPNNPLKDTSLLQDERQRYEAAKRAVEEADVPVRVSDFEFSLPRPNYTAQTLRSLVRRYPQDEFPLVIGEDNWHLFSRWRDWQYIARNHTIFVYPRHYSDTTLKPFTPDENCETGIFKQVVYLEGAPYFDISSTQLRKQKL